jgi:hypothetical protein
MKKPPDDEERERERERKRKRRRKREQKPRTPPPRLTDSVRDFCARTGVSVQTAYKLMADGRLRYVQVTDDLRRIPTTEYVRLGFVADVREVA